MVVIGGLTRLTGSGLSMVDWQPVTGFIPPMSDEGWQQEFENYQTSPQYKKVNSHMGVEEFKGIFWLEFIHRVVGRVTGIVFLLPLMFFIIRKRVDRKLAIGLGGVFLLGGIQGVIGWYMVTSGLKDDPHVSHFRLTLHLVSAFIIYSLMFIMALRLWGNLSPSLHDGRHRYKNGMTIFSYLFTAIIFIQVAFGGLVAGLKAGTVYNTFPLMDGEFIPDGLFEDYFFESIMAIQFSHRMLAFLIVIMAIIFFILIVKNTPNKRIRNAAIALMIVLFIQFALGVATLIYVVPIALASIHQAVALVLLSISLFINYELYVIEKLK